MDPVVCEDNRVFNYTDSLGARGKSWWDLAGGETRRRYTGRTAAQEGARDGRHEMSEYTKFVIIFPKMEKILQLHTGEGAVRALRGGSAAMTAAGGGF